MVWMPLSAWKLNSKKTRRKKKTRQNINNNIIINRRGRNIYIYIYMFKTEKGCKKGSKIASHKKEKQKKN